ncbi:MAG: hypothetical protein K8H85_03945 [Cyclobacteriaceae bacterium]|nr:hypothetical protein [Cyclobacteriaceae bacterium]
MKLIPFDKIELRTKFTSDEIESILKSNTNVGHLGSFTISSRTNKLLEGEVGPGSFTLKRRISYRNSFQPIMIGDYSSGSDGTIVSIKFRLYTVALVFAILFLSFGLLMITIGIVLSLNNFDSISFLPNSLIITLCFYVILVGGFNFELMKSKQLIRELLEVASR